MSVTSKGRRLCVTTYAEACEGVRGKLSYGEWRPQNADLHHSIYNKQLVAK